MYLNTRSFLFTGVALAGLLAGLGGFLFFANVPDPGASRQEVFATLPPNKQLQTAEINRIIAERQALAPKPSNVARAQVAATLAADSPIIPELGKAEERFRTESADASLDRERDDGRVTVTAGLTEPAAQPPQPAPEPKSKDEAANEVSVDALRAAANRNDPDAQYSLAARLESGQGVAVDKIEALKFYILAASNGVSAPATTVNEAADAKAATPVTRLMAQLTPAEVREAEARVAAFREQAH